MPYFKLNCEICGFNKVTDETKCLVGYKQCKVQTSLPKLGENNKTVKGAFREMPKKFKCPQCGRLLSKRQVKEVNEKPKESGLGGFERT